MGTHRSGFTLVELVLVLVIIGLLSAVAIPKYINANNEQQLSEMKFVSGSVRTAWVVAKADTRQSPTVNMLASYVQAEQANAANNGIVLQQDGHEYTVPTYLDDNCTTPTRTVNDRVACVGSLP